ncbi:hypothetical protein F5Y16DRAFT_361443 [Xylariaceae sp. FL0255]|nr:hypothetical protein F5Y16DRAFT_361443 [Xylariaceae sp. FL0255]
MAPAPSANLPLKDRVLALVQTLQFGWFAGHVVLLLCIFRYLLSFLTFNYYSRMAQFSYRTAFVSAAVTYGIVVYKTRRARQKVGNPVSPMSLLSDENVQYLGMALVWLFTPQYMYALLPYGIYSVFHVATYVRTNVLPTLQPAKGPAGAKAEPSPLAERIGAFVKQYYEFSMSIVSGLEIVLWIRLLSAAIVFTNRSWIVLAIYTAFLRARFAQSTHVQNSFGMLEARIDSLVGAQGTPPVARTVWDGTKGAARQFHAVTDISKYLNGSSVPKKTS